MKKVASKEQVEIFCELFGSKSPTKLIEKVIFFAACVQTMRIIHQNKFSIPYSIVASSTVAREFLQRVLQTRNLSS